LAVTPKKRNGSPAFLKIWSSSLRGHLPGCFSFL
jgi:hypothetical protein